MEQYQALKKSQELLDFTKLKWGSWNYRNSQERQILIAKYNLKYAREIDDRYERLENLWNEECLKEHRRYKKAKGG